MLDRDGFPIVKRSRRPRDSVTEENRSISERSENAQSWRSMVTLPTRESMTGGHIIPRLEDAIKHGVTYFQGSTGTTKGPSQNIKFLNDDGANESARGSAADESATRHSSDLEKGGNNKPAVEDEEEDEQVFVDLLAGEIERKTNQDLERSWYEHEDNAVVDRTSGGSHPAVSTRREKRMISYLKSVGKSLFQVDQERWEKNRLRSVGFSFINQSDSNEINQDDYRDYKNIISVAPNVTPPFLENDQGAHLAPGQFTRQRDIPLVVDPNCDMAQMAKNGSPSLKQLKEQAEKSRDKFWQLSGTAMGNVIGLRDDEARAEEVRAAMELEKSEPVAQLGRSLIAANQAQTPEEIQRTKARLPITACKKELMNLIRENSVIVLVGETGSGKTTQLTQILLEEGCGGTLLSSRRDHIPPGVFSNLENDSSDDDDQSPSSPFQAQTDHPFSRYKYTMIGCTQPRRVAAVSVAKRVSDEMGVDLGKEVGYSIRFEDCTSEDTKIKYMTDAYLLRETLTDPLLDRYDVIIMDEAHERSLATDVLLGLLKRLVSSGSERAGELKLIITSATMNSKLFSEFFGGCPVYQIPGRTFPVTINYLKSVPKDYIDQAIYQALKIHTQNPFRAGEPGDILIFMTGQEDIEATAFLLVQKIKSLIAEEEAFLEDQGRSDHVSRRVQPLCVLPIYSTLPADLQSRVFEKSNYRKVIIATNIAETSLTLDGVRFVIDCGLCKLKVYSPQLGMDTLQLTPISRANAQQRSGRAGRTAPGVCYRLYSEQAFYTQINEAQLPEIQRSNLSHVVLLLRSIMPSGNDKKVVAPLAEFPFLSPPAWESIRQAEIQLWMLGALDDDGRLTRIGKRMSSLPVDPSLARMILTAEAFDCVEEILTIVACLSVPSVFYHPRGGTANEAGSGMSNQQDAADSAHEKFFVPESDHLTLMNVYNQWIVHKCSPCWTKKNYLQQRALLKVKSVRDQLSELVNKPKLLIGSYSRRKRDSRKLDLPHAKMPTSKEVALRKCIASGYFHHAGKLKSLGQYVNLRTSFPCHLHPNSALILSGSVPQYVVYHEVLVTTKEYMHTVTAIEPEWLVELAPTLYVLKKAGYS